MAFLTKEEILEGSEISFESLTIQRRKKGVLEDVQVLVRGLDGYQRSLVNSALVSLRGGQNPVVNAEAFAAIEGRVALMSLVDEAGARMFSRSEITNGTVEKFAKAWESGTIQDIFSKAQELSGMAPGAIEDAAGNSEAAQNELSTSD